MWLSCTICMRASGLSPRLKIPLFNYPRKRLNTRNIEKVIFHYQLLRSKQRRWHSNDRWPVLRLPLECQEPLWKQNFCFPSQFPLSWRIIKHLKQKVWFMLQGAEDRCKEKMTGDKHFYSIEKKKHITKDHCRKMQQDQNNAHASRLTLDYGPYWCLKMRPLLRLILRPLFKYLNQLMCAVFEEKNYFPCPVTFLHLELVIFLKTAN